MSVIQRQLRDLVAIAQFGNGGSEAASELIPIVVAAGGTTRRS